ncbi:MAG: hypothetical protein H6Q33_42 [Deltaproteobacteria bacterium]|nr:hypothetical protein [Deltaproteobacteria bacterium]
MEAVQTVVAVTDSPAMRETLSVLLEHDCELQFLDPACLSPILGDCADLALVAVQPPGAIMNNLKRRWPALPVVAVHPGASCPVSLPGITSVPLEPLAIRNAVREGLRVDAAGALRKAARLVATTLRAELTYAFAALRALAPLDAGTVGNESYALFAVIIHEQLCVITSVIEQLERYQARPRAVACAPRFTLALLSALARSDTAARTRGLLCHVASDTPALPATGPVGLAPLIAELLRCHLRRRSGPDGATVRHTGGGITLRYRPQPPQASPGGSWPLLLISLLLQRWSWRAGMVRDGQDETIAIRRA